MLSSSYERQRKEMESNIGAKAIGNREGGKE